jgi:hypothetical protein
MHLNIRCITEHEENKASKIEDTEKLANHVEDLLGITVEIE